MHIIVWLVVSAIAGYIASRVVNKSGSGLLMDLVLGVIGGFVGGFIIARLPMLHGVQGHVGLLGFIIEIIVAALGAMLVIWLWDLIFRRGRVH